VLNELDWWIASQWETFQLKRHYSSHPYENRTTKLKKVNGKVRRCICLKLETDESELENQTQEEFKIDKDDFITIPENIQEEFPFQ
ncbi:MAG: hypothetical protein HFI71_13240, partial [Lachnospiraceae bacterium]|nr:hypothetical protein [Lachnospiraceae bacterium]